MMSCGCVVRLPRARMPSLTQEHITEASVFFLARPRQRKFKSTFSYKKDFLSTHDSGQKRHVTHNIPGLGYLSLTLTLSLSRRRRLVRGLGLTVRRVRWCVPRLRPVVPAGHRADESPSCLLRSCDMLIPFYDADARSPSPACSQIQKKRCWGSLSPASRLQPSMAERPRHRLRPRHRPRARRRSAAPPRAAGTTASPELWESVGGPGCPKGYTGEEIVSAHSLFLPHPPRSLPLRNTGPCRFAAATTQTRTRPRRVRPPTARRGSPHLEHRHTRVPHPRRRARAEVRVRGHHDGMPERPLYSLHVLARLLNVSSSVPLMQATKGSPADRSRWGEGESGA